MAGASDKARYYLEQIVPELREWERREIFTKNEITSIAAKRSDFEHLVNSRDARPATYARYTEYEINLDALHRKRVRRKGVKATPRSGQQRIFSILKRATTKFPGNVPLWMQYVEYARKQHASKKVTKILTEMLRLHPQKPVLWIYAARYTFDVHADMTATRGYMQRALRFCPLSPEIHLEYARLEMNHLAKIWARKSILGIGASAASQTDEVPQMQDVAADVITLPTGLAAKGQNQHVNGEDNPDDLTSSPAMNGAIPLAIFNAAMDRFSDNAADLGRDFFDMFSKHNQLPFTSAMLNTVVARLIAMPQCKAQGHSCQCRLPIVGISHQDPKFPAALTKTLSSIRSAMDQAALPKSKLSQTILSWLSPLANEPDLLPELRSVLQHTERQLSRQADAT